MMLRQTGFADRDSDLEHYEYPAGYREPDQGARLAAMRIEALRARSQLFEGHGSVPYFEPGRKFTFGDTAGASFTGEWVLLALEHRYRIAADQRSGLVDGDELGGTRFWALPAAKASRQRPTVSGGHTAMVRGPAGEEIHTDPYGRFRAQWHWDREATGSDADSRWMRKVQEVGTGQNLARVGWEMFASFVDGDPDRPIGIGRAINGEMRPAYALPDHKNTFTFKTPSSPSTGGYNELRMTDSGASQEIHLRAEKDLDTLVKNDKSELIGNDETHSVGNDFVRQVTGDQRIHIGGNATATYGHNYELLVEGDRSKTVGVNEKVEIAGSEEHRIGGDEAETVGTMRFTMAGSFKVPDLGDMAQVLARFSLTPSSWRDHERAQGRRVARDAPEGGGSASASAAPSPPPASASTRSAPSRPPSRTRPAEPPGRRRGWPRRCPPVALRCPHDVPWSGHDGRTNPWGACCVSRDDAGRDAARYQALCANPIDVVCLLEPDGRYKYLSPSVEPVLGFRPDELEGHLCFDFYHPDDVPRIQRINDDAVADERIPRPVVMRVRHRDGHYVWIEATASPVFDPETGELIEILGVNRDISERMRLEHELYEAQRTEIAARLASSAAHDLNNLLTVIATLGDSLYESLSATPELQEDADDIRRAAMSAGGLGRELLGLSRPAGSTMCVFEANEVVERVASMTRRAKSVVKVHTDLAAPSPLLRGDPARLEQVLLNLALNAAAAGERVHVSLATRWEDDRVRISCADDGPGVPETIRGRIFERNFTTRADRGGSGIGLSTALRIVEGWDGTLSVESAPGGGALFTVSLPAAPPAAHPGVAQRGRVLIVEHDPLVREALRGFFRHSGHEPVCATGVEAERVFGDGTDFAIIVADERRSGWDVARALRHRRPLPTILTSGASGPIEALERGEVYLPKPFSSGDLTAALRGIIDRGASPALG